MEAFHGIPEIKEAYLDRVIAHQKADHLIRGEGWDGERGCAVGCTLENYDHASYEIELGIPPWLAKVEDVLFEGMNLEKSKTWPEEFLKAIPIGVNLEQCKGPFLIIVLKSTFDCFNHNQFPDVKKSLDTVIDLWEREVPQDNAAWAAASAAANDAANDAAKDAAWDAAGDAAGDAAKAAAWAAASAARYDYFADELLRIIREAE